MTNDLLLDMRRNLLKINVLILNSNINFNMSLFCQMIQCFAIKSVLGKPIKILALNCLTLSSTSATPDNAFLLTHLPKGA